LRRDTETPSRADLPWQRLPDAPSDRTEVTATSDRERVFVIGGLGSDGQTVSTVEIYDPEQRRWSAGPALTLAVNHAMSASVAGTIYVVGGYLGPGLSNPTDRAFALQGARWIELPRMPETRAAGGAAAMGDRIYVAGGVGPDGLADRMLVFDVSSQS
jgi:N-acetylneuraminic acid mutarotase